MCTHNCHTSNDVHIPTYVLVCITPDQLYKQIQSLSVQCSIYTQLYDECSRAKQENLHTDYHVSTHRALPPHYIAVHDGHSHVASYIASLV